MSTQLLKPILLFGMLFMIASTASAQFSIGPMLAYDSKSELGLGVKAKFPLLEQIQISPSIAFFSTELAGVKSRAGELNADAQYYFNPSGETQIYGVLGLNLGLTKISGAAGDVDGSSAKLGLNLGAGAEFAISESIQGFGQARYTLRKADRLGIQTGVYFSFGGN